MHCHAFSDYMRHIDSNDWTGVSRLMLSSANKLASIGAELLLAPCNTIHRVFDLVAAQSLRPWLHIAAEVAAECKRRGFTCVALLGTSFIMQGNVYTSQFDRLGIKYMIPEDSERARLNQFIFQEMVLGRFTRAAREFVLELMDALRLRGCDAAGLCCTELPILLTPVAPCLPVLDSTRCLANAAVNEIASSTLLLNAAR
jgi:aspartate racemase